MDTEKIFKTKTGYCHVLDDKIVLTRNGVLGALSELAMGNNIARPLIIYGLVSIGSLVFAFREYNDGDKGSAAFSAVVGIFLMFAISRSFNNSASPVIDRQKIKGVEFKKALPGATRAYFIVHFENEKGYPKRRFILLPGSLSNGGVETEKALQIMASEFPIKHI